MFIIVESGSTKADWVIVDSDGSHQMYKTDGINPSTHTLFPIITDETFIDMVAKADDIFFYGAGADDLSSPDRIQKWLQPFGFSGRTEVKSDLYAAARACSGHAASIVCILGTGSNSCVYDGTEIIEAIPSLGYIFSDEGGGVHLGKEIIKDYFYGNMPDAEKNQFESMYHLTKSQVIEEVYRNNRGSKYIASFALFLTHVDGVWKDTLIKRVFREFVHVRILKYSNYQNLPIVFVGSIAFHYQNVLEEVLSEFGLHASAIIRQPIINLIDYHQNSLHN